MFQFQFHPTLPELGVSCGEDGTSRIWKKNNENSSSTVEQQSSTDEEEAEEEGE